MSARQQVIAVAAAIGSGGSASRHLSDTFTILSARTSPRQDIFGTA